MKIGDVWGSSSGKMCGAQKIVGFNFSAGAKSRGVSFLTRSCSGKWSPSERFRVCASESDWNKMQTKARRTLICNEKA